MVAISKVGSAPIEGEQEFARMLAWPRQFLAIQTAVSAAGDDLDGVLRIILKHALRLVPAADGGEIELREGQDFVCRARCGSSPKTAGSRSPAGGIVPGFCSISAQDRAQRISINGPIAFNGEHVGLLRLHSAITDAFSNRDLLALQLLAGLITQGLERDVHAKGEKARRQADRRFAATFDQAAVGIAHVDPQGRFIMVNDKFCDIAGHDRDALIAHGFEGITHPDDLDADLANVSDLLAGRIVSFSMEKRYIRGDASTVWVNLTVSLVHHSNGDPDFFVSVIEDVSARRAAELDAEQDPLTGLLNRRGALRRLEAALAPDGSWQHGAWQHGIAVAFIDLDRFKAVNDGFGHAEGDRCLAKVAAALRKCLRSDDVIARMGGDEFLVLFPAQSDELVNEVIGRLQAEVLAVSDGEPWNVSASFGVAIVPAGEETDPQHIVDVADRLMYQAKQSMDGQTLVRTVSDAT